ncbi:Prepilin-type N-terminal cleavage/methylation domain-containing protein [Crenothrix polyspora]|uniref:Prepilin-type N-terminal cleavage/methylation domain-containing protein n=1 Tax=Crenothrix polyspora TaxID=360316 RepID=A0A1R4H529_9GAMM|nr:type IV pilin protein [Crenothrix polyspora]SJM91319.1 Prepilin-type N-terminal cleavage/methylation domain-containing protein [Crenothrix polyspora]
MKTKLRGFTIIELLMALGIVGILAAITYPSYSEHIAKSKRAEAQAALVAFANAMEVWKMQHNNSYLQAAGTDGAPTDTGSPQLALFSSDVPISGGTATYNLTISAVTNATYTLTATPVATDACGTLTIDNMGIKAPLTVTDANGVAINCW